MQNIMKSCIVITSLLLMLVPHIVRTTHSNLKMICYLLIMIDGLWVNDTLIVNGSTNVKSAKC